MNKDKRNNIKLLGTLNNADESGIIANANQIYDANEDKSTQDVSKEHKERIKTLETKENSMQTTLENITKTGEASAASNVTYNHSDSKLDATNVQQAIDEMLDNPKAKTEINVIDKNKNKIVSISPTNGVLARAYNVVNSNGDIVKSIDDTVLTTNDIVNDVKTGGINKSLSAEQGVSLSKSIEQEKSKRENDIKSLNNKVSNALYNYEDSETELTISDTNKNKIFSADEEGIKARKINFVNSNGDIISHIDSDTISKVNTILNTSDVGKTCHWQEKVGTYYIPKIDSVTDYIVAAYDYNKSKFSDAPCIRVSDNGEIPVDSNNNGHTKRGSLILNFDKPIKINETLSIWIYVPYQYTHTDRRNGESTRSIIDIQLTATLSDGTTFNSSIYNEWFIRCGWSLSKLMNDDLVGKTIVSAKLDFYLSYNYPKFTMYFGDFVADQRMYPTVNYNMDADFGYNTSKSGFPTYVLKNSIPINIRFACKNKKDNEDSGYTIARELYKKGIIDNFTYTVGVNEATTISAGVEKLLSNGTGKKDMESTLNCQRPVIAAGCNTNYIDDFVATCLKEAGFKIARGSGNTGEYYSSQYITYFDKDNINVAFESFGAFPVINGKTANYSEYIASGKTDDDLQAYINNNIASGKKFIDDIIKYGVMGNFFTHDLSTLTMYKAGENSSVGAFAEVVEAILDYALEKQTNGELYIMTLDNFYHKCTNN